MSTSQMTVRVGLVSGNFVSLTTGGYLQFRRFEDGLITPLAHVW